MTIPTQRDVLKTAVVDFLTPQQIAQIAMQIGYDSKDDFTPSEYDSLLHKTTEIVLGKLNDCCSLQSTGLIRKDVVSPIVDEILREKCKCIQQDRVFPDPGNSSFQKKITSWLWSWVR